MTKAISTARRCPLCEGEPGRQAFPFETFFDGVRFKYLKCRACATVFVDPVPAPRTFGLMYQKSTYHDAEYRDVDVSEYETSGTLLASVLPPGSKVLDYGCGLGDFLLAAQRSGLFPTGVEFDAEAAAAAAERTRCTVYDVNEFAALLPSMAFDAVHFGDVLEHVPDPMHLLREILKTLRPGGFLFVEGPLETNPSPVFWASSAFGHLKRTLRKHVAYDAPTHLFRTDAVQQRNFFSRACSNLSCKHWEIYETGWPYIETSGLRKSIALVAKAVGGRKVGGAVLGNRFRGIFQYSEEMPGTLPHELA